MNDLKQNKFKTKYCTTLCKENTTQFIKIPIANYELLNDFKTHMLYALEGLAIQQAQEANNRLPYAMRAIIQVLQATNMLSEYEGLDNLTKD